MWRDRNMEMKRFSTTFSTCFAFQFTHFRILVFRFRTHTSTPSSALLLNCHHSIPLHSLSLCNMANRELNVWNFTLNCTQWAIRGTHQIKRRLSPGKHFPQLSQSPCSAGTFTSWFRDSLLPIWNNRFLTHPPPFPSLGRIRTKCQQMQKKKSGNTNGVLEIC